MSQQSIPKDLKSLRACLMCSLIKSLSQFKKEGCANCDQFLKMRDDPENVYDFTSKHFYGMISVMCPEDSWVSKWQRISKLCKGVYAISVSGHLPIDIVRKLKRRGIVYKSRDNSRR